MLLKSALKQKGREMNTIQGYRFNTAQYKSSERNRNSSNAKISFKALEMDNKQELERYGKTLYRYYDEKLVDQFVTEMENLRPILEERAKDHPKVDTSIYTGDMDVFFFSRCAEGHSTSSSSSVKRISDMMTELEKGVDNFRKYVISTYDESVRLANDGLEQITSFLKNRTNK